MHRQALLVGDVEQDEQFAIDEDQLEDGFRLLCTSYPRSDLIVKTHQEEEL